MEDVTLMLTAFDTMVSRRNDADGSYGRKGLLKVHC